MVFGLRLGNQQRWIGSREGVNDRRMSTKVAIGTSQDWIGKCDKTGTDDMNSWVVLWIITCHTFLTWVEIVFLREEVVI